MFKYKIGSLVGLLALFALVDMAKAEVKFSGSVEADLMYRTNNGNQDAKTGKTLQEIAAVINVDGIHPTEGIIKNIKWRIAQKTATDYRYDSMGLRETWLGTETDFGEFRAGNQFSNFYLMLDWPYGGGGMGNLWADFGAHEVQYGRALTYISPNLEGFTIKLQYDMGDTNYDTVRQKNIRSYANEVVLNYNNQYFGVDLGYYMGKNSGTMDSEADVFGGNKKNMTSGYGNGSTTVYELDALNNITPTTIITPAAVNEARAMYVGTTIKLNPVNLYFGFENNNWKGTISGVEYDELSVNKIMAKATYTMDDKNSFSFGVQKVLDSKQKIAGVSKTNKDSITAINLQYNRNISKNALTFVQIRHEMLSTKGVPSIMGGSWQLDGISTGKDGAASVTRFLVGAAVSF